MSKHKEYPLTECNDCIHNKVCRYISWLTEQDERKYLPIDLDVAVCKYYEPDSLRDEGTKPLTAEQVDSLDDPKYEKYIEDRIADEGLESLRDELLRVILEGCEDVQLVLGGEPTAIICNSRTKTIIDPSGKALFLHIDKYKLKFEIDEEIALGQFHIAIDDDEEEDEEDGS